MPGSVPLVKTSTMNVPTSQSHGSKVIFKRRSTEIGSEYEEESDRDSEKKYAKQNHSEIEKRRRDKMNMYIGELSTLIPMCSAMNRKLDKLTILRMTVQHMKVLMGAKSTLYSETLHKPSFLSDDDLKHLILQSSDGFLFVVSCDRGRLLFVSESVKDILHYSHTEIIGQSFFDIVHPNDIQVIKEHLSSSDLAPRERLIDAKTMLPVKSEMPTCPTQLSFGARRSFFCRMKKKFNSASSAERVELKSDPDSDQKSSCSVKQQRKENKKQFCVIHCTGYVKSWAPAKLGLDDMEGDNDGCNLSCLVAVGRLQPTFNVEQVTSSNNIDVHPMEFMSRHTTDGKFTFVDLRATAILGYLPQELIGTSVYEYYHLDDLTALANTHKQVLKSTESIESPIYRFKTKDKSFIKLRTKAFSFHNPWTKEIESVVATNTVIAQPEISSSSGQSSELASCGQTAMSDASQGAGCSTSSISAVGEQIRTAGETKVGKKQKATGTTHPGAGRVGRQVCEEVLEKESDCDTTSADTYNLQMVQPSTSASMEDEATLNSHRPQVSSPLMNVQPDGIISNPSTPTNRLASSSETNIEQVDPIFDANSIFNTEMYDSSGDDAAMAVLMSLLEADAGLGGPVDFSDLPWPL
ncbi:protein cycle-like [Tubulanus polymorphus]|uniref:protein cycle-like n=1 Tax=Tubulanus polymorphus TaxID=672921 RepID=UPI003DA44B96